MLYLGIFFLEFENNLVIFEISTLEFMKVQISEKEKQMTKCGLEFKKKIIVVFEISTIEFV